jgi:hypothetical protein
MAEYERDHIRRAWRMFRVRVDLEDKFSQEWIGVNRLCSVIPWGALNFIDSNHHQRDDSPVGAYRRFRLIEWAEELDWFHLEDHTRGWISVARDDDHRRGA